MASGARIYDVAASQQAAVFVNVLVDEIHAHWNACTKCCKPLVANNLVDPASSHMLVSKIKPCMSQYKFLYGETANGSLKQL